VREERLYVANNGSGVVTVHNPEEAAAVSRLAFRVPVPEGSTNAATPTGLTVNRAEGATFVISNGVRHARSQIIFVTENGTIGGWNPNVSRTNGIIAVDNSGAGAVYKGVTFAVSSNGPSIYAANFHAGVVE